ncbi:MAG: CapA family protein [Clostridia bacterium]|nr:CapA family protein [Clostridia bacterium]
MRKRIAAGLACALLMLAGAGCATEIIPIGEKPSATAAPTETPRTQERTDASIPFGSAQIVTVQAAPKATETPAATKTPGVVIIQAAPKATEPPGTPDAAETTAAPEAATGETPAPAYGSAEIAGGGAAAPGKTDPEPVETRAFETETPGETPTPKPAEGPGTKEAPALTGGEVRMTVSFTGDVTLGGPVEGRKNQDSFDSVANREGYDYFFRNVKSIFEADDLTLVNLEGVLSDSASQENKAKTFRFRGRTDFAEILTRSGIEACAIANNHIRDFGQQGYQQTVKTLRENDLRICGNDLYFVLEKGGAKAAFFAFTGNYLTPEHVREVADTVRGLRRDGVGAVVCCFHAGQEYSPKRRAWDQEQYAKIALDEWGADLVVMHHPHVLQGIDIRDGRYVFYSLGNFCFGGNNTIRSQEGNEKIRTLESCILQMDLLFDGDGQLKGQEGRIFPCYISSSADKAGEKNDYQPRLVSGAQAAGVIERIQADTAFEMGAVNPEEGALNLPYLASPLR